MFVTIALIVLCSDAVQPPAMILTPLGKTLSAADREWFRTAAAETISGGRFKAPRYHNYTASQHAYGTGALETLTRPTIDASCQYVHGVGFPDEASGGDFPVFKASDCCQLCQLDTACLAAAFVNTSAAGGGICHVKTTLKVPAGVRTKDSVGCVVAPNTVQTPSSSCDFHPNMQLYDPGSRYTETPLPAANEEACCGECEADRECFGAVLFGTACYKKTAVLPLVKQAPPPGVALIAASASATGLTPPPPPPPQPVDDDSEAWYYSP
eukprot:gene19806-4355_t